MNNKLFGAIIFATGAVIGSVATWFAIKTKYEQIAQDEIDSVKEEFDHILEMRKKEMKAVRNVIDANKSNDNDKTEEQEPDNETKDDADGDRGYEQMKIDYSNIAKRYTSSDDDNEEETDEEGVEEVEDEVCLDNGPYVISPEEFGNETQYSAQPLDYFADGVLADGWGVKLDIDDTIGEEALDHFGDYVDDVVHVRNDQNEIDYEVTRDPRTYEEARQMNPNPYYGQ